MWSSVLRTPEAEMPIPGCGEWPRMWSISRSQDLGWLQPPQASSLSAAMAAPSPYLPATQMLRGPDARDSDTLTPTASRGGEVRGRDGSPVMDSVPARLPRGWHAHLKGCFELKTQNIQQLCKHAMWEEFTLSIVISH